jgi:hypothetical protein
MANRGFGAARLQELIQTFTKYDLAQPPYHLPCYGADIDAWWAATVSEPESGESEYTLLMLLATLLRDVVPHAGSPERTFSLLGYIEAARRNRLVTLTTSMLATSRMYYLTQLPQARKAAKEGAAAERPAPSQRGGAAAGEQQPPPSKKARTAEKPVEKDIVGIEVEDSEEQLLLDEQGQLDASALEAGAGTEDNDEVLDDGDLEDVMGALQAAYEEEKERTDELEELEREREEFEERERVKNAAVAANRAAAMDYASGVIARGVVPELEPPAAAAPAPGTAEAFGEGVLAIWKGFNINSPVLESNYKPPAEAKKSGFCAAEDVDADFDVDAFLESTFPI